jgi:DNA polymerase-3 subunit alpha
MSKFLKQFKKYDGCTPPGVQLPQIKIDQHHYEGLDIPETATNYDFLSKLCRRGVKKLGISQYENKKEYFTRTTMELEILSELGFIDYILLNWDILHFCHTNSIPTGPGRGSAAGSLVLYLIGVTKIDPIKYDLFFERFVSKSRAKKTEKDGITYLDGSLLADIDNDISYEHRQEVIKYIEQKYPGRTAKILTLNTLSSKLCIRECGKIVGGYSETDINAITALIPKNFGKVASIESAISESEKFKDWAMDNGGIVEIAKKIERLNKNTGVHPSGIAISHDKISSICPLQVTKDGAFVTAYDMNWVSELMVKFDILGLRTLSVIYDTCSRLQLDPLDISLEDEDLYKPLQDLKCAHGLFQIEANTDFKVCKKIKPKNLEELSAVVAIARPGALDFLDSYAEYSLTGEFQGVHEFFDSVLEYTGGIPLYQEQLMKMAEEIGFTLDEAEQLRRIVGKKKVEEMPVWRDKITSKIEESGLDPSIGEVLWRVAEDSANYSFNKSHSIAYATLAAWTTYLKFNHPQDFFLSLLKMTQFEPTPQAEVSKISMELPHFNIKLLPPNILKSKMDFSPEGSNIRYGLSSIKGISDKSLDALRKFRDEDNSTKFDLFLAAKQAGLNIGVLSALIQAGALSDDLTTDRPKLVLEAQLFNILTDREKRNFMALAGKDSVDLFAIFKDITDSKFTVVGDDGRPLMKESRYNTLKKKYDPYKKIYYKNSKSQAFANWYFERELLGFSYSSKLADIFSHENQQAHNSLHFESLDPRESSKYIFVVAFSKKEKSRNGNLYIKLEAEDEHGTVDAILVDNSRERKCSNYLANNPVPKEGNIVTLYGAKTGDGDAIFIDNLKIIDEMIYMNLRDLKGVRV